MKVNRTLRKDTSRFAIEILRLPPVFFPSLQRDTSLIPAITTSMLVTLKENFQG